MPKSLAKPSSPLRTFVHPNPAMAPELVFADKTTSAAAGSSTSKKAAQAADVGVAAAAAAPIVSESPAGKRPHDEAFDASASAEDASGAGAASAAASGVLDLSGRELSGMAFYFAGTFKGGRPKVIQAVTGKGGSVVSSVTKATHILVPSGAAVVSKTLAAAMQSSKKIPVVSADFVEKFDLAWRTAEGVARSGHLLFDSPPGSDIVTVVETAKSLASKAGSMAARGGSSGAAAAAPAKRRKISDQQLVVDPECGYV